MDLFLVLLRCVLHLRAWLMPSPQAQWVPVPVAGTSLTRRQRETLDRYGFHGTGWEIFFRSAASGWRGFPCQGRPNHPETRPKMTFPPFHLSRFFPLQNLFKSPDR